MTSLEILHQVWQRNWGAFVFLPMKDGDVWHELPAVTVYSVTELVQPVGFDIYFTPACYTSPERSLAATGPIGVLYADLDGDYDREALDKLPPTLLWETSPGNLQAIWFTDPGNSQVDYHIGDTNRRLSHFLRADHGSWIPTKLLRVPGSINYKRGGVEGRVLEFDPSVKYHTWDLDDFLPEVGHATGLVVPDHPAIPDDKEWRVLISKWWDKFDYRTKQLLVSSEVPDRSLHLARLAKAMATISMPPQEIFGILSKLSTNKFASRPEVLWKSVVLTAVVDTL